jgi:hypothetical protein
MNIRDFVKAVDHDTEVEGWDMDTDKLALTVRCKALDKPGEHWYTTFQAKIIQEMEWEDLKEFAMGRRKDPLETITRIIGYYSPVSRWNASKTAELRDRRAAVAHYADLSGVNALNTQGPAKEEGKK